MSRSRARPVVAALWLASVGACTGPGPVGPIPGGEIRGEATPPPADWSSVGDYRTVQLETRPAAPYSVNVWGVGVGPVFFVACRPESTWVAHIEADPNVRLRIDGRVFELRALRSDAEADFALYLREMRARYDWQPSPADAARALLFRLEPRPSSRAP